MQWFLFKEPIPVSIGQVRIVKQATQGYILQ